MSYLKSSSVVYKFKYQCDAMPGERNSGIKPGQQVRANISQGTFNRSICYTQSVYDLAIGQHLLYNSDCASGYTNDSFIVFGRVLSA